MKKQWKNEYTPNNEYTPYDSVPIVCIIILQKHMSKLSHKS